MNILERVRMNLSKGSTKKENKIKAKKEVVVFDIDNTLYNNGLITRVLQRIAEYVFKLSFLLQRPNRKMLQKLNEYDKVIILSARSRDRYLSVTLRQFKKNGIKYDKIILFPERSIKLEWKKKVTGSLGNVDWYDDESGEFSRLIKKEKEI